jgi:N-acetylglucosamine-6-phosphate deacetylase
MDGDPVIALANIEIISSGKRLRDKVILVSNGKIVDIVDSTSSLPHDAVVMDLKGNFALPGLIDLQIYGSGGMLFGGNPTVEALERMEQNLCEQGVTGFLATIATNTDAVVAEGIRAALTERSSNLGNCWGLHLEGPYLNPAKRGAHPAELIQVPTTSSVEQLLNSSQGCVKMMTVAPERMDKEVLDCIASYGIVLSAGHSNATYEEGKGFLTPPTSIRTVTHLFNAMPTLHHRDLGFTLAVLEDRPFASIVADGIHVAYPMIRLAKQHLAEKLFLITDAVTDTTEGIYPHILHSGDRYVMPDGTLSGSALTLMKAMQNCVNHCDIALEEAVNMATLYPAQVLRVDDRKGKLEIGYDADICIMSPDFRNVCTFIGGRLEFSSASIS